MAKPLKPLSRLHQVLTELIDIHEATVTPLLPSPLCEHLANAIEAVMLAQKELLFPDKQTNKQPAASPLDRQRLIETALPPSGQPKPSPVTKG